jgi:hypothetical protein
VARLSFPCVCGHVLIAIGNEDIHCSREAVMNQNKVTNLLESVKATAKLGFRVANCKFNGTCDYYDYCTHVYEMVEKFQHAFSTKL